EGPSWGRSGRFQGAAAAAASSIIHPAAEWKRAAAVLRGGPGKAGDKAGTGSVAVQLLAHLAPFLRFERQGGGGAGQQAGNADGFAGFLAPAVFAAVDAGNRLLHFLEQLALAVAGAQLERVFFLDGGAVGRVGHELGFAQVLG